MKKIIFSFLLISLIVVACNSPEKTKNKDLGNNKLQKLVKQKDSLIAINANLKAIIDSVQTKDNESSENEDFDKFFWSKFLNDELFQKSRVKFPLENIETSSGQELTKKINSDDWNGINLNYYNNTSNLMIYDNFNLELSNSSNERVVHEYGIEQGGVFIYYFKAIDGKWFLTKVFKSID